MRKDLPKLYKGNVLHEVNNNIYYSSLENKENIGKQVTIDELFANYSYIFKIDVVIKTKVKEYHTKIAGKIGDSIITLDNDVIPIKEIISIIVLSK